MVKGITLGMPLRKILLQCDQGLLTRGKVYRNLKVYVMHLKFKFCSRKYSYRKEGIANYFKI